jgi:GNAT superfamily N-acetyltransferase
MPSVTIRPAIPADMPIIETLIGRSVRATNAAAYPPAIIERICAKFTSAYLLQKMAERDTFVASQTAAGGANPGEGEAIIGTISLGMSPVLGETRPKLHTLYVAPEQQRRGIGAYLVDHIEALARSRLIPILHLSAALTARPFYARLGYELMHFEERPDGSTWLMSKRLG